LENFIWAWQTESLWDLFNFALLVISFVLSKLGHNSDGFVGEKNHN